MCVVFVCLYVCVCVSACVCAVRVPVQACVHEVKIYHRIGTFNCVLCVCTKSSRSGTFNGHSSLAI